MNLVDIVNRDHLNAKVKELPNFKPGDTISVSVRVTEGAKTRIQLFQGVCMGIKRRDKINGSFRVRKISAGLGVERVFPFHSPAVEKVEIVQQGSPRKAKLYYLREREGKSARIAIDYEKRD
ncbi:MAG: 50S ribosomal protein L19 [Bdellovibrionales bacterium RIFOXYD12_FULL_39_22]|nr:MAG: 50S ribosomal protein L19 [Bdellovibrionales bacterium RIFOXYB1_FULL_39_21]OFZ45002.1 MAG: 50S ribosomal protein L19 [Bdellovibrionales bacterium RIFOXYC12_FULL_39_17]OFZ49440.1 MAG: 50S ribosomal protein L19 [Bdellovibrionales bacterium RIFOXYC1_FULL_39_130]OFZ73280.1 MAG: 50S ribosomal protein L19 [Bdellovibrionales bacterium RIFOXYC2_FULL_39_8]OFZ77179.1 MAG: 50S ribosomal protein L19 [Bdellovibrionales bacterium RIFOXYD1_FULL_39_84]OFZ95624.1 MAG: 50S ribosomal protein L19 [Bdellov